MEIRTINPTNITDLKFKRVAAYARVSSDKDAAENSLSSQIEYFSQKIAGHPGWVFAGMYADNGISGTKENRPEFLRMMADARSGKIDIIITKSIARFARNLVLLLDSVRELRNLGVDVVFENDHISSMSVQGELLLSLLAMHAEEQSKSASENKRWQIKRYFEEGVPTYVRMFGYQMIDNHLEIIPEEAVIIRRIFQMYLSGMGREAIARTLNAEGYTLWGKPWRAPCLHKILRNEKYKGDMLLQKTYCPDFRSKVSLVNHGEVRQYYVHDSHQPIVEPAVFDVAQREIERRSRKLPSQYSVEKAAPTLFSGILKCALCGKAYLYKNKRQKSSDSSFPVWLCSTFLTVGKGNCPAKQIRESILIEKTKEVLELPVKTELTRDILLANFTSIESAADNRLRFFFTDGRVKVVKWENPSRSKSWTPEMRQKARERILERNKRRKEESHD